MDGPPRSYCGNVLSPERLETVMNNQDTVVTTYGIDIGKTWFHVVGVDANGRPVKKAKLNRCRVESFFVNAPWRSRLSAAGTALGSTRRSVDQPCTTA